MECETALNNYLSQQLLDFQLAVDTKYLVGENFHSIICLSRIALVNYLTSSLFSRLTCNNMYNLQENKDLHQQPKADNMVFADRARK